MILALGLPNTPTTICWGMNPGNRYASVSRLVFLMNQENIFMKQMQVFLSTVTYLFFKGFD
jgi:hypothetical protein